MKNFRRILGLMILVAGMASVALADTPIPGAPEIDPGTAGGALTMIIGGLCLIRDRFRGK